jgi:ferredoxin
VKRIVIDADLCQGSRECAAIAPGAVEFDDVGVARPVEGCDVVDDDVAARLVATCPSMAVEAR